MIAQFDRVELPGHLLQPPTQLPIELGSKLSQFFSGRAILIPLEVAFLLSAVEVVGTGGIDGQIQDEH